VRGDVANVRLKFEAFEYLLLIQNRDYLLLWIGNAIQDT
jgi:hypothetical protein